MEPRRKFRFLKELSEGNFGKVYMAEMITGESFSSVVAIKLLHGKWLGHDEIVQRSRDEARVLGLLHHRNIVRVEDLTSINGQCAVIMEYLEGVDVKNLVTWCNEQGTPFPRKVAFEVVAAIASALEAAYYKTPLQGGDPLQVIHRDIKPSNVMVTVAGDVKVLDFGTAQAHFEEREAKTQALAFGSAAYMAPERLLGDPDAPSGDVFSLGVTLYEMLAGKGYGKVHIRPEKYDSKLGDRIAAVDLSDLPPETAEQVRVALKLMLAYEPEDRPDARQVGELMEALAEEVHDGSLRRFCREVVVPARELQEPHVSSDDSLTGSTLFEDRSGVFGEGGNGEAPPSEPRSETWYSDKDAEAAVQAAADAEVSESAPNTVDFEDEGHFGVPPELQADTFEDTADDVAEPRSTWVPAEDSANNALSDLEPQPTAVPDLIDSADLQDAPTVTADQAEALIAESLADSPAHPPDTASGSFPVVVSGIAPAEDRQSPLDTDEEEPAEKSGGFGKLIAIAAVLVLVVGLGGVAIVAVGLTAAGSGSDGPTTDPVADPVVEAPSDAVPGGRIEVGPVGASNGTLTLALEPVGEAAVSISSVTGYKQDWDGSGKLELVGLPAGTYKTKVSPKQGRAVRSTVEVQAAKACAYTYNLKGGGEEWEAKGCE